MHGYRVAEYADCCSNIPAPQYTGISNAFIGDILFPVCVRSRIGIFARALMLTRDSSGWEMACVNI